MWARQRREHWTGKRFGCLHCAQHGCLTGRSEAPTVLKPSSRICNPFPSARPMASHKRRALHVTPALPHEQIIKARRLPLWATSSLSVGGSVRVPYARNNPLRKHNRLANAVAGAPRSRRSVPSGTARPTYHPYTWHFPSQKPRRTSPYATRRGQCRPHRWRCARARLSTGL